MHLGDVPWWEQMNDPVPEQPDPVPSISREVRVVPEHYQWAKVGEDIYGSKERFIERLVLDVVMHPRKRKWEQTGYTPIASTHFHELTIKFTADELQFLEQGLDRFRSISSYIEAILATAIIKWEKDEELTQRLLDQEPQESESLDYAMARYDKPNHVEYTSKFVFKKKNEEPNTTN